MGKKAEPGLAKHSSPLAAILLELTNAPKKLAVSVALACSPRRSLCVYKLSAFEFSFSKIRNLGNPAMLPPFLLLLLAQPLPSYTMPPEWNLPSMPASWALPSGSSHRCVPIPSSMELCTNIGYREMRLPNMLNHDTVAEVTEQTKHWVPLANLACHRDIRVLLCSIYAPVCIPQILDRQIKPCRSLCDAVMRSCINVMQSFGFDWPEILNCTQFPPETDLMCIQSTRDIRADNESTADCHSCPENITYESVIGNYCVNRVVFKARIESIASESDGGFRIQLKRRIRFFKSAGVSRQQKRGIRTAVLLPSSSGCRCASLEAARNDPSKKLLMMGSVSPDGSSFSVKFLTDWQPRNRNFKRAMRRIRGGGRKRARGRTGTGGGDPDATLCSVSQLNEPLPTALTADTAESQGSDARGRKNRKNRRKKAKRNRRNKARGGGAAAAGSAGGGAGGSQSGAAASAGASSRRQTRRRSYRAEGNRRMRGYSYDKFYYTNYHKS